MSYWRDMVAPVFDRADEHKPQSRGEMRVAALEMARSGLLPRDIAASLGLTESAVRQLLEVAE
ncbi:MAG: hypothetical protein ACREU3_05470 [Steroidobacteraceae bacterium]